MMEFPDKPMCLSVGTRRGVFLQGYDQTIYEHTANLCKKNV